MRSPDQGQPAHPRAGRKFEDQLALRYLSPGAFTVLPPDDNPPPDPPVAPAPYRLTPSTRRNRNQAFAIIAEPGSRPGSRSPSPTGRVSPFRGRGFNPAGSRHASPAPSPPPPDDMRIVSPQNAAETAASRHTKIPQPSRRGSGDVFGEKVGRQYEPSKPAARRRKLQPQLSQSLTDIPSVKVSSKPPPSPRRAAGYGKAPAFQRLSPISGSSPEPSQSQSSPSRIPIGGSQPTSRLTSPTRTHSRAGKSSSRPASRNPSRNPSRDASPAKPSAKNYRNVQAKVNSFSRPKPKVPPKPHQLSEGSSSDQSPKRTYSNKPSLSRSESVNKMRTPRTNNTARNKDGNAVTNSNRHDSESESGNSKPSNSHTNSNTNKGSNPNKKNARDANTGKTNDKDNNTASKIVNSKNVMESNSSSDEIKNIMNNSRSDDNKDSDNIVRLSDLLQPSTTAVVSSTTTTVTKPLKIDAKMDPVTDVKSSDNTTKPTVNEMKSNTNTSNKPQNLSQGRSNHSSGDTKSDSRSGVKNDTTNVKSNPTNVNKNNSSNVNTGNSNSNNPKNTAKSDSRASTPQSKTNPTVAGMKKTDDTPKSVSPMVDGRILSATSVSNAMNKMNDTVLNTKTLMKEHGFTKLSPAAHAIISMSQENKASNPGADTNRSAPNQQPASDNDPTVIGHTEKFNNNHIITSGLIDSRILEREVQRNMSRLISPDHVIGNSVTVGDKVRDTVLSGDVKPLKITVKEKPADLDVQSGNVRLPVSATNGLNARPSIPPSQQQQQQPQQQQQHDQPQNGNDAPHEDTSQEKTSFCGRMFTCCKKNMTCRCCKKNVKSASNEKIIDDEEAADRAKTSCFSCCKKRGDPVAINIEETPEKKPSFWSRLKCCNRQKVQDSNRWFSFSKRKANWAQHKDSMAESQAPPSKRSRCSKSCFQDVLRKMFCLNLCCKKKPVAEAPSRRASMVSKKKSLTPMSLPPEEIKPKLDMGLVEHSSVMKGAIPVLPVCLAWFCLTLNVLIPGLGTIFSGMFCLCLGIPRFSQKDGLRQRIGAFVIDFIIGIGQCFTVLFCLVGWGWSIWWGVIMVKTAKKYRKIKILEAHSQEEEARATQANANQGRRGGMRGS